MILFDFIILYQSDKINSINRLSWIFGIKKFSFIKKILKLFCDQFGFEIIIIVQKLFAVDRLFEKEYRINTLYSVKTEILACREL